MEKNKLLYVKLYPEISNITRDNPPIVSFIIRVVSFAGDRKALTHPGNFILLISCAFFKEQLLVFRLLRHSPSIISLGSGS